MTMEILSNFASIYCYIAFVIGAVLMLVALAIAAMGKDDEPRNKVRFFVTKDYRCFNNLQLWLGRPKWDKNDRLWIAHSPCVISLSLVHSFKYFKLNPDDFTNMKMGKITVDEYRKILGLD